MIYMYTAPNDAQNTAQAVTSRTKFLCLRREVLNKAMLPRRTEFGLPEDKIIFSCSNQLYKYDPDTFTTWCNTLKRVPDR